MYKHFFKRLIDIVLSFIGIIVLALPMLVFAFIIKAEDPGPVFFRQKRIGIHKTQFSLLKFRSMKISTPHDMPTHMLENPEQYILRCGRWMRKMSIDELPQIFNIFTGKMSIIGPRPALWNQDDLIAERDKYGVNDAKPGLTGLAQINGRDELEIPVKAKLDGEYVAALNAGHGKGLTMDCECFFGTIKSVLHHDGVRLGAWLANQKGKYKKFKFSELQISLLEKIGIIWSCSDDSWDEGYRHAEEYFMANGNLDVKTGYTCDDGFKLAVWLGNKRTSYRNSKLPTERVKSLEKIGM